MFVGFVVFPSITGNLLIGLFNPPKGGHIYGFTIKDVNGDSLEVEVNNFNVSERAKQMKELGKRMWVGGKVVLFDNEMGFRFDPDTIVFGDVVGEGSKTTLRSVKENLNYWIQFDKVYVNAEITSARGLG